MRWLTESQVSVLSILWRCTTISELMINEQIRDREVRLIGANGEQLGIMSARDAQKHADRKSTRLNSSHNRESRMPSSA